MAVRRPRSQQQQPGDAPERDAVLIAGIAALLAIGAASGPTASRVAALIGVPVAAVAPIVALAKSRPFSSNVATLRAGSPSATGEAAEAEGLYRAAYVLAASRRVRDALRDGKTRHQALADERRWFALHMESQAKRRAAAVQVDKVAKRYGPILGWYAKLDAKTSPECRAAHGKNFNIAQRPAIGYPGSVHPHCRCRPGRKFATSATVYSVRPERKAA